MTPKLPEGWTYKSLEQIAQIVSGGTPARDTEAFWLGGDIPWVTPTDITGQAGSLLEDCKERITHAGLKASSAKLLPAGTLLMTSRATLGEIKIAARPVSTNQGFKNLIPSEQIDGWYLYYQMLFRKKQYASFGIGSTFLEVSKKDTARFEIPVPSKQEQTAIAKVLISIDTAIRETEAIIAKLQAVKQGLLHDLLTRGLDASGQLRPPPALAPERYQNSPLGLIPREWEVRPAHEICEAVIDCKNRTPPETETGFVVVKTSNVRNGRFLKAGLTFTDHQSYEVWTQRGKPRVGDVLITREAPVGEVCSVPSDIGSVCLGQRMMMYRPAIGTLNSGFLLVALLSPAVQSRLDHLSDGSTVGHVRVNDIRTLLIPTPPLREQAGIASTYSSIESRLLSEEATLTKLKLQKSGLMDDLLTGRVRVQVAETEG